MSIDDPDYARFFTKARTLCWQYGYSLMMHGSVVRDFDVVAVPWTKMAVDPQILVNHIADVCSMRIQGEPSLKEHGRLAWTFLFEELGDPRWVDFSAMPRIVA